MLRRLRLSPLNFSTIQRPSRKHKVPDAVCRLCLDNEPAYPSDDDEIPNFEDETVLAVHIRSGATGDVNADPHSEDTPAKGVETQPTELPPDFGAPSTPPAQSPSPRCPPSPIFVALFLSPSQTPPSLSHFTHALDSLFLSHSTHIPLSPLYLSVRSFHGFQTPNVVR